MSREKKNRRLARLEVARQQAANSDNRWTRIARRVRKIRTGWLFVGLAALLVAVGWWWNARSATGARAEFSPISAEIDSGEHRYTNRLIHEKSPYLLQHAHNPVDWYPWGEDAFEKARREQKPISLSVGYSTCHWCHVMERESFSNPEIAAIMNEHFVSIKVDREERPDVDSIYMTYVQAATGSGGWPMSVFLTPDRKPFHGGTYFPPEDRYGRPGFRAVLLHIARAWENDRQSILQIANRTAGALETYAQASGADTLGSAALQDLVLGNAYEQIKASHDATYGGFGRAPKFPRPVMFNFLLRYYARTGEKQALQMTLHTLRSMAKGGMHDHIGGGFHRYSTDAIWHVPHFEKMLYDQAQLAISYAEAYQITRDPFFAGVVRDILRYVHRDMRGPHGGFYSAEDADSLFEQGKPEHGEGAFYIWEAKQIEQLLGGDTASVFNYYYGVEPSGNVPPQKDFQGEFKGRNILIVRHTLAETAKRFAKPEAEVDPLLEAARKKLFEARSTRPRPPLDDKVLTAWNGLMISAYARAAQALDEPRYLATAQGAAGFLRSHLFDPKTGKLNRRYREGHVAVDGFLEDYAFLIQGLLDLYEASFDVKWLAWAVQLQEKQDQLFWDSEAGGYFSTTGKDPSLLVRMKEDYDGAEPAANSVAAMNLLRLSQMADRDEWRQRAQKTLAAFSPRLKSAPQAMPQLAAALDFSLTKTKQIVIAGKPDSSDTRALLRLVHERYIPNKILLLADGADGQKQLAQWLSFIEFVRQKDGRATAYICENYVCKLPTADPEVVARLLDAQS